MTALAGRLSLLLNHHRSILTVAGATILGGTALLLPLAAHAQTASVACEETALVTAITAANAAGGGTVTLTPGCTYTLTASHGDGVHGPAGLPIITTPITFEGNANTITRSSTASAFRIAQVNSTGGITLKAVTLSGGHATTTGHDNGGGILNFGAVTLTGSHLSGNTADGLGGAIYSTGTSAAATNAATNNPGGIYYLAGSATLTTSTVTANTPTNCTSSPSPVPGCIG